MNKSRQHILPMSICLSTGCMFCPPNSSYRFQSESFLFHLIFVHIYMPTVCMLLGYLFSSVFHECLKRYSKCKSKKSVLHWKHCCASAVWGSCFSLRCSFTWLIHASSFYIQDIYCISMIIISISLVCCSLQTLWSKAVLCLQKPECIVYHQLTLPFRQRELLPLLGSSMSSFCKLFTF
jgi:hypothetical protein